MNFNTLNSLSSNGIFSRAHVLNNVKPWKIWSDSLFITCHSTFFLLSQEEIVPFPFFQLTWKASLLWSLKSIYDTNCKLCLNQVKHQREWSPRQFIRKSNTKVLFLKSMRYFKKRKEYWIKVMKRWHLNKYYANSVEQSEVK